MTNRTTYIFFTKNDDSDIQEMLDNPQEKRKVAILIGGNHFELKQNKSGGGTSLTLSKIGETKEEYSRFVNSDCSNIETFVKLAKDFIEFKRQKMLADVLKVLE